MLIVDEAHNFRTEIKTNEIKDPDSGNIIESVAVTNKRGYQLMKYGSNQCHKIILLTGTAFVNKLYDIENLLSMIDTRKPISQKNYKNVLDNVDTICDYFNFRISYYESSNKDGFFPERREHIEAIYMTEEQKEKYNKIKVEGIIKNDKTEGSGNPFYIAEKFASNMIDKLNNPKLDYIVKLIKSTPNQKFIIYTGLYDSGVVNIETKLNSLGIKSKKITGRQNSLQKEESKLYFNYYNFNDTKMFNPNDIDTKLHKFINNEYRVLIITKAGAEGVDTVNCQNIILFDSQWNDTTSEQIIARAIRFKSHNGLPEKERYVNVIRVMFCFPNDKNIIDDINKGSVDFANLYKQIKDAVKEQLKNIKIEDERYLPTVKELKSLKSTDGKPFIPDETKYEKKVGCMVENHN